MVWDGNERGGRFIGRQDPTVPFLTILSRSVNIQRVTRVCVSLSLSERDDANANANANGVMGSLIQGSKRRLILRSGHSVRCLLILLIHTYIRTSYLTRIDLL